jgi:hypothetical protein
MEKVKKKIFFNPILRAHINGFMKMNLSAMLALKKVNIQIFKLYSLIMSQT